MHQLTVAQCQSSAEPTARGKLGQAWWKINGFCPPSCTKIHSGERKGTSLVDDAACLIPRQFRRKLCFFVFFFSSSSSFSPVLKERKGETCSYSRDFCWWLKTSSRKLYVQFILVVWLNQSHVRDFCMHVCLDNLYRISKRISRLTAVKSDRFLVESSLYTRKINGSLML